jgi:hypothetical protein
MRGISSTVLILQNTRIKMHRLTYDALRRAKYTAHDTGDEVIARYLGELLMAVALGEHWGRRFREREEAADTVFWVNYSPGN